MGNNMTLYTFAVCEKYTKFVSTHYKFIENDKIEEGMLLNSSSDSLDPYDCHLSKNGWDCLKRLLECNQIHSPWPGIAFSNMEEIAGDEEDIEEVVKIHEKEYTDGCNEVVKSFNQKCFICLERNSEYIFKQCGHQCSCEDCYQIKGDIDILNCVICRTK